jgi:hypothetical protein
MLTIKYPSENNFRLRIKTAYLFLGVPDQKVAVDIIIPGNGENLQMDKIEPKNRQQAFVVPGPGEYEIDGVYIFGPGDGYWEIGYEDWRLCLIGGKWQLPKEKKVDKLGQLDVLFLTLLGKKAEAKKVMETVKRLSPRGVVFGYDVGKDFLDEIDREDIKPVARAKIKQSNLTEEGTDYFALKS